MLEVLKEIVQTVAELDSTDVIVPEALLGDDLGLDSLMLMDVAMDIAARLGVTLDEKQIASVKTFGELAQVVGARAVG
jgi:acyl carrier protein